MKKILFIIFIFPLFLYSLNIKKGSVQFTSKTDLESFQGGGSSITGNIDLETRQINVTVNLEDWETNGKLRTAHMHENYLETDKFPEALFTGKITSYDNVSGKITALGNMRLHGVRLENFRINGYLNRTGKGYHLKSEFIIKLTDFSIPVPQLLVLKVSNEIFTKVEMELDDK